jgi:hypothetical protein
MAAPDAVLVYDGWRAPYRDLGLDHFDRLNKNRLERSLVKRLEKLGHRVILEPRCPAA